MRARTALLLLLPMLAASASADLAYKTVTTKNVKKGKWEAKSTYIQFKGNSPLVTKANASMRAAAESRLKKFVQNARENAGKGPMHAPFYFDEAPTVGPAKSALITVVSTVETYEGGAHGYRYPVFDNWAVVAGKPKKLVLADLLVRGRKDVEAVSALVIGKLGRIDRADWVQDGTVRELDKDTENSFTVTKTGLRYIFAPYVMGCYASGTIEVDLPWVELKGLVNPNGPLSPVLGSPH